MPNTETQLSAEMTTKYNKEMLDAIRYWAKKNNRSVGGQIRQYVMEGLEREVQAQEKR